MVRLTRQSMFQSSRSGMNLVSGGNKVIKRRKDFLSVQLSEQSPPYLNCLLVLTCSDVTWKRIN